MARKGTLFILVGPSGAGKNTLMKRVQQHISDLPQLATVTTREMRPDEQEGREHRFVTKEEFQRLIDTDALIEYQPVHSGNLYGTPRDTVENALHAGQDLIADIEFLGAGKIYNAYPENTVLIFVTPSNLDILAHRVRQRGDISARDFEQRMARGRFELTFARRSHYVVLNDVLEPAAEHLRQIILSERQRRGREITDLRLPLAQPETHSEVVALVQYRGYVLARTNSDVPIFPSSVLEQASDAPHDILQSYIDSELSQAVSVNSLSDARFDFIAPHYIELAVIPHAVYLYYYYCCTVAERIPFEGWQWVAVDDLKLPAALHGVLQSGGNAV